jgi:hypothetical protein
VSDEKKVFDEAPIYTGDEALWAALIGTLCGLMDPMVDELDAYEIAKDVMEHVDALDYPTLELIVGRIKMAATVHEAEVMWN